MTDFKISVFICVIHRQIPEVTAFPQKDFGDLLSFYGLRRVYEDFLR